MIITREISIFEFEPWSGAVDTINTISEHDKMEELEEFLETEFNGEPIDETELNDYLWYESDYIFQYLGIDEEE